MSKVALAATRTRSSFNFQVVQNFVTSYWTSWIKAQLICFDLVRFIDETSLMKGVNMWGLCGNVVWHPWCEARPSKLNGSIVFILQSHALPSLHTLLWSIHESMSTAWIDVNLVRDSRGFQLFIQRFSSLNQEKQAFYSCRYLKLKI